MKMVMDFFLTRILSFIFIVTANANTDDCITRNGFNSPINSLNRDWVILKRSVDSFISNGKNLCTLNDLLKSNNSNSNFSKNFKVIPFFEINSAILYHCSQSENSTKIEELFILSRDENSENFVVQTTELLLRNFGFRSPTVKVDQSECREQKRREEMMQRRSIRRLLVVPDADYVAEILYRRCVASAINAVDIVNCMQLFNEGHFHIERN